MKAAIRRRYVSFDNLKIETIEKERNGIKYKDAYMKKSLHS